MIVKWNNFLESVKITGIKKARKKEEMFDEIHIRLKSGGRKLKDVITSVAEELSLKGTLKAHKSGAYGITFLWGNKTLKITTSDSEAKMIADIIDKQDRLNTKSIIRYDHVYELKFKGSDTSGYYVILMEQIRPLELKECKDILNFYKKYLDGYFNFWDSEIDLQKKKKELISKIKKTEFSDFYNYVDDMVNIIKDYKKLDLKNDDIHWGNLGLSDDGHLVSFDPMGDESKDIKINKLKIN